MAKLYFKYGAMGSSKTAQALITKYNYEENDMKVWLIKPSADTRDGAAIIRSRIGLEAKCEIATPDTDIYERFRATRMGACDVIIADECQFLTVISSGPSSTIFPCRCCASACAPTFRPSCSPALCG